MLPLMAILGLVKGLSDVSNHQQQNNLAAATTRFSPWTGDKAQQPQKVSFLGDLLGSMAMGYGMDKAGGLGSLFGGGEDASAIGTVGKDGMIQGASPYAGMGRGAAFGGGGYNPLSPIQFGGPTMGS